MNRLNRILVAVLGVQIALILVFHLRGDDTRIGKLEPLFTGLAKDKVERIRVFDRTAKGKGEAGEVVSKAADKGKAGDRPAIDLTKKNGAWVLASHFDYPVDAAKVTEVLDKVEALQSRGPIASGKARQKQLEVADDSYDRKVVLTTGGKDVTFYLGAGAGSRQTSVRIAGTDEVHGVTGLTSYSVGAQPSAWISGPYIDVAQDKIASVDLVNANGSFHFERAASGGDWQATVDGKPIAPPAGMEISKSEIDKVMNRASKIYMAKPGDPKRTIDKPIATITLHLKPEPPPAKAGADKGAAQESAVEEAGEQRVIEIASTDEKDRSYVREKGRAQAALVDALSVTDLAELSRDRLVAKIGAKKDKDQAGEEAGPGDMPMEGGLPPGFDPDQMGGQ